MSPEAADILEKAHGFLAKASGMLAQGWADEAGRAAYLAAFHAAQALILTRDGRIAKTHAGVRNRFGQIVLAEPTIDAELRRFLAQSFVLKSVADYETGAAATVSTERAAAAIGTARRFLMTVTALVAAGDATLSP